eukprot:CAMPEP_0117433346 /NCGR_PEP_ID=MMETSP0758-20121206/12720_1 /TAXON_ID=63605 /ORGANISM="Percolomonas cosmopolitus, Strain AE-1 (ATCC 50343)" /LENGTH=340 /DNA_ID=CAMNT_0005223943 /DNA_START=16 /DNA_END=1035 /DNA_ORIENTATION=-
MVTFHSEDDVQVKSEAPKSSLPSNELQKAKEESGKMTLSKIKAICEKTKMYQTPHLNELLYLHNKGFRKIENLDQYVELRTLYLEGNILKKIEGLENLTKLRCLYLHQNMISKIEGISHLTDLQNLNLSRNNLTSVFHLSNLSVLDLQSNHIDDPSILENVLQKLPSLKVLYLKGNPVVNKIKSYRRHMIFNLPQLTFLDDKPVSDDERRCCKAWGHGGIAAEQAERRLILQEKRDREKADLDSFRRWQAAGREKRVERLYKEKVGELSAKIARRESFRWKAIASLVKQDILSCSISNDDTVLSEDELSIVRSSIEITPELCRRSFVGYVSYPYEKRSPA